MGAINAFGAVGGFVGTYIVGALGGGTKSGAAFMFLVRQPNLSSASSAADTVREPHEAAMGDCRRRGEARTPLGLPRTDH